MKKHAMPPQYRHNAIVRLCHWINVAAFFVLLFSGLQIFNAHPRLYWGHDSQRPQVLFETSAKRVNHRWRGSVNFMGIEFDTTGVLGVSSNAKGESKPRGFPNWLTLPSGQWLAMGRRWHAFFAWIFVINGLVYVTQGSATFISTRSFFNAPRRPTDAITEADLCPAAIAQKYNRLQRYAYLVTVFFLCPSIVLSGMAMSPYLDAVFHSLPEIFGGRQSARTVHFFLAWTLLLFTVGHVAMTVWKGFFGLFHAMVSGWYYAR